MRYITITIALLVLLLCTPGLFSRSASAAVSASVSEPRAQFAEMGDYCLTLAGPFKSCLLSFFCCPLSCCMFFCGHLLKLPTIIMSVARRVANILRLVIETPSICLKDLSVMLSGIPQLCRICYRF